MNPDTLCSIFRNADPEILQSLARAFGGELLGDPAGDFTIQVGEITVVGDGTGVLRAYCALGVLRGMSFP